MTDKLKVGDRVIVVNADSFSYGEVRTLVAEKDGCVFVNGDCSIGYFAITGAGWLDREGENGRQFVRKITPLEELL